MKYKYIRGQLQTGDIVLFSGRGLFSLLIRAITRSRWSHVGMVLKRVNGELYILESDYNKVHKGVQISHLGRRIKQYKGKVCIRQLETERTRTMQNSLNMFINSNRTTSYESGIAGMLELMAAAIDFWPFHNKANEGDLFCSETMMSIFQLWGFVPQSIPSNEITPADFNTDNYIDELLQQSEAFAQLKEPITIT